MTQSGHVRHPQGQPLTTDKCKSALHKKGDYAASIYEKIVSTSVAVCVVALVGYLVIRNQPFAEPQFALLTRILLSFAVAVLGATIPGFLHVDWSVRGLRVRAAGALALFAVTYSYSPTLAPALAPTEIQRLRNPKPVSQDLIFGGHQGLREGDSSPLELRAAFQEGVSEDRKLYDFTISNSSDEQRVLNNFHLRWVYHQGLINTIEVGRVLQPQEKYSVTIPVNLDKRRDQIFEDDVPVSPPIMLPPKNESGPSIATLRLEVLCSFDGGFLGLRTHAADWNILYDISVLDDKKNSVTLLRRSWRDDRDVDWVKDYK